MHSECDSTIAIHVYYTRDNTTIIRGTQTQEELK